MPHYLFSVHDDGETVASVGIELPHAGLALAEAVRGARALAADQVLEGRLNLSHRIEIADETGAVIANIVFRDAIAIEGR